MAIKRSEITAMKFGNVVTGRRLAAIHPGEVLLRDFIEPMLLTRYRVAKASRVPQRRIDEICSGKRAISADTALRLGHLFGVEPQFWMNLQSQFDLEIALRDQGAAVDSDVTSLKSGSSHPAHQAAREDI